MRKSPLSILLAGIVTLFGVTQTFGQTSCKPVLTFKEVRFSDMRAPALQRVWAAHLAVDASRCTTTSGSFSINFIRLKEMAPDLPFTEQFTWHPGRVDVSVDFWADEAVLDYSIGNVDPCTCRN